MKNKIIYVLIILIVGLNLAMLTGFCSEQKEVVIGVIGPMTGAGAQSGNNMRDAVALGIEEINKSNRLPGISLKMVVVDDEGNPITSINGNKRLVHLENAIVVIGSVASSCTLANMEVTKEAGVPQITSCSTSPEVTKKGNKWIFRTAITDAVQAENTVKIALDTLKKERLAVIYVLDDFGQPAAEVLQDVSERMGHPPVIVESFNPEDKDFSSQLLKIKEKNPDALIIWSMYEPAALIARQVAQMDLKFQLLGGGGLTNNKYVELGGADTNGTMMPQSYHPSSKEPHIATFTEKFKEKYGRYPDPNAAQSYDAIMIVAEALEKVGVDDKSKIRDAIASIVDFNGVTGSITFDETGDAPREMKIIQVRDGNYELY